MSNDSDMLKVNYNQKFQAVFHPTLVLLHLIRQLPFDKWYRARLETDGLHRTYYGYGLYQAAIQAKRLGLKKISAIEFGVAAGHGLLLIEQHAKEISKFTGVEIQVYGFDLKEGLPEPSDYRDLPYIWQKGFYKMDHTALKSKLQPSTQLILGDVAKTVAKFAKTKFPPVGFIAFDLDFYSSTVQAFKIFSVPADKRLPRVFCYFDDVVGSDEEIMCDSVGELLAIKEFNQTSKSKQLAPIHGLIHKRVIKATWSDMVYVMHDFKHPLYNTYIYNTSGRQMAL